MSEFIVTLSELEIAAGRLKDEAEEYLVASESLKEASDNLTGFEWQGDAAETYRECMDELNKWMLEMSEVVTQFGTVLDQIRDVYQVTDQNAASFFPG